jgi:hypothetical protein
MPSDRPPMSFRLSDLARELIRTLSDRYGLSQAGVIELAMRELARRGVDPLPDGATPEPAPSPRRRKGPPPSPPLPPG